ncbi:YqcC family protein [BEV proteobacterium]|nr:YqcC family protein [Candidatus Symbiopectobacterium sp. Chty_BC]
MTHQDHIRHALWEIERTLRDSVFWQSAPPQASAFTSTEPFCIDTMSAEQWLQWVLLPRLHAILDGGVALPQALAITPYFEEALTGDINDIAPLLEQLCALDALFVPADAQGDLDA